MLAHILAGSYDLNMQTADKKVDIKKAGKLSGRISLEKISHFRCGKCNKWWSIADAPKRDAWFCPWCGVRQKVVSSK